MKRIINLILITTLAGLFVFLYSCKEEFLDKQPTGTAAGEVMKTEDGVEGLLIGAYDMLPGNAYFGGALGTDWTYGDCASDNTYKGTSYGDQSAFNAVERYNTLPANPYMSARWSDCYNGVSRTNDVLNFLWTTQEGDNPISDNRATEIEAEAKFLRAWYHFKATRIFEKIPYVKTEEELGMPPEEVPNDSEGWDEIEADLQYAIDNLPENSPMGDPGRPHKYAAMAVKAHVHMFQNELGEAETLLDDIIGSNKFALVDNYYDNYKATTENNEESIFEIQVSADASSANYLVLTGAVFHQSGAAGLGWGFFQPSQNLFEAFQTTSEGLPVLDKEDRDDLANDMAVASGDSFEPTDHPLDPRVDWTIARRGVDFLGWGIHQGRSWIRSQSNGGPYMTKKYMHLKENDGSYTQWGGFKNARNFRAYRYSHVLLWRAEIAVENNELDYARQLVNQIRERAKNSDYVKGRVTTYELGDQPTEAEINWDEDAANYNIEPYPDDGSEDDAFRNQEEARKAVRLELRLEFATEGLRYFQLRRWGIAEDVLNDYIQEDVQFRTFMQGASYDSESDDYWPLPQDQLDIQPSLEQDPAYK